MVSLRVLIKNGLFLTASSLLIGLSVPVQTYAQEQTPDVQLKLAGIALLERDGTTARRPWTQFLDSESDEVRRQAILAMGRLKSAAHLGLIRSKLADPVPTVRQAAAFSYGLMDGANSGQLFARYKAEPNVDVRATQIRAIGRIGTLADSNALRLQYETAQDELKPSILYALADLNRHRSTVDQAFIKTIVARFIKHPIIYERRAILNWLQRSPLKETALPMAFHRKCLADENADVRQVCVGLIADKSPDALALLAGCLNDKNTGVKIAAVRQLGQTNQIEPLVKSLAETFTANVKWASLGADALATLDALMLVPLNSNHREVISSVFQLTLSRLAPRKKSPARPLTRDGGPPVEKTAQDESMTHAAEEKPRPIIGEINCASAAILDRMTGRIQKTRTCGGPELSPERRIHWQLLAIKRSGTVMKQLKRLYMSAGSAGRIRVIDELANQPESRARDQILFDALSSQDSHLVIRGIKVAVMLKPNGHRQALVDLYKTATSKGQFGVIATLFEAYASLELLETVQLVERHADDSRLVVKRAATVALARLESVIARQNETGGIRIESGRRDRVPPPAFMMESEKPDLRLAQSAEFENALIYTTAGDFLIQFHMVNARQSVKRFVALIKRQFFKDQRFFGIQHGRWIQTGDPTNTGFFIPGQLYRPEINQRPVKRGAIGLVPGVGGLDGTKWFISLVDKPELDGQITVIGVVKEGLDVLYRLSPSDRIIRVELLSKR
ncbi:MAG: HEAT repeat domain-containing protein [Myxococcota bacterium]|nr:HEAT repeat domain-containing protein [Myxococcota bacterium]